MAGILELLRGTTDPTTPGTGLGDIYFKGASDAAMLLYYRRPDGSVVELASASGGLVLPSQGGTGVANNNASTLAITGAFATTFVFSASTTQTFPTTSATLARTDAGQTFAGANSFSDNITISTNNKFLIGKNGSGTSINMIGVDSSNMTQLGSNSGEVVKTVVISPPASDAARAGGFAVDSGTSNRFIFYDKDGNRFYVTGTSF